MTTFALVHGSWVGAWCWELLTPLLQEAGHDVVTMDLPCNDGSASFETYADVVCTSLDGWDKDIVLVGHSLAGNTIPLVAARRPVRHLVYLCAVIPDIGRSMVDQWRDEPMLNPDYVKGLSKLDTQNRTTWVDLKLARALLFADCDEPPAMAALNRLGPQARYPSTVPFPLAEFPSVRCTAVVCSDDQFVYPDCLRQVARDRLGADIVELPGSHSPFLSRPSALAEVLLRIADGNQPVRLVDWVAPLIQPVDFEAAPGEEHKWYKMMGAAHLLPPQEKLSYHALPDDPAQALNILREAAGLEPLP